ncbi:MAG: hypothetical protein LQ340_006027 [Diploschistes diacapsis]|nr:MAG: hypothetical protein LQ340_006027 [Diploschistes diacapsis]
MAFRQSICAPSKRALIQRDNHHLPQSTPGPTGRLIDEKAASLLSSPRCFSPVPRWLSHQQPGPPFLSDFGSLNTVPHSESDEGDLSVAIADAVDELDSLDEGLYAFRDPASQRAHQRSDQNLHAILPAHDGLGTFPPSRTPPNNRARSPSSRTRQLEPGLITGTRSGQPPLESVAVGKLGNSSCLDDIRIARIEQWRLEHSKHLLQETADRKCNLGQKQQHQKDKPKRDAPEKGCLSSASFQESLGDAMWQRFAHRIVTDLMGTDDATLCIIFGENIVAEGKGPYTSTSNSCKTPSETELNWRTRLLWRLTQEIRKFALQFSPVSNSEFEPPKLDYAGMPIEWLANGCRNRKAASSDETTEILKISPTLRTMYAKSGNLGLDTEKVLDSSDGSHGRFAAGTEYLAQVTGLRTVFRFLCGQLLTVTPDTTEERKTDLAISQSPEALRRAAIVQKHHPLASSLRPDKSKANNDLNMRSISKLSKTVAFNASLKRANNSCASWSTKRSRLATSDEDSRNYWDLGESLGTGSAIFAGVGVWGDL